MNARWKLTVEEEAALWAKAVGPPGTGASSKVTFFSPRWMAEMASPDSGSPACFWACAVGPPFLGWSKPVSSFSLAVTSEMVSDCSVELLLAILFA